MNDKKAKRVQKRIHDFQDCFRILEKWKIRFDYESEDKGRCYHNSKKRTAVIYDWGKKRMPKDYLLHEILHICQAEMWSLGWEDREIEEEMFIQDLCRMIIWYWRQSQRKGKA